MLYATSLAVLLPASATVWAAQIPFEAAYAVENDYVTGGIATLRLARDKADGYLFSLQSKPTGIFRLTRSGNIREQARLSSLEPPFVSTHYSYTDKGRSKRSYEISFNRDADTFEINRNGAVSEHAVESGVVDRLSVTLALLDKASTNPDFEQLEIRVLDGKTAETVTYSNRGMETIRTEIGQFDAIRVLKDRVNSTRETIIWLARVGDSKIILPLRIEQYKKGKLSLRLKINGFKLLD